MAKRALKAAGLFGNSRFSSFEIMDASEESVFFNEVFGAEKGSPDSPNPYSKGNPISFLCQA